jgi:hypothetical protein
MNIQLADSVHQCLVMPLHFNTTTVHYKGNISFELPVFRIGSGAVCVFGPFEPGSGARSRSVNQVYGSKDQDSDPDPHQNITDSEQWN